LRKKVIVIWRINNPIHGKVSYSLKILREFYGFKGSKEVAALSLILWKSTPKGKAKSGIELRGGLFITI